LLELVLNSQTALAVESVQRLFDLLDALAKQLHSEACDSMRKAHEM